MRIAYSALTTLLLASAVTSVGEAQVLTPFDPHSQTVDQRLDHVVPVATVSLVGDAVALADARTVRDRSGEPFVLGAAKLDLRDPAHAKVVFTMTNATQMPIPLSTVQLQERTVVLRPDKGDLFFGCLIDGRAGRHGQLEPGATVTVQIPVSATTNCLKDGGGEIQAFLVFVGRELPQPDLLTMDRSDPAWRQAWFRQMALFRRAFEKLLSRAQR